MPLKDLIADIRGKLGSATPGQWVAERGDGIPKVCITGDGDIFSREICVHYVNPSGHQGNPEYIAAVSPDNVARLLDALDQTREALEWYGSKEHYFMKDVEVNMRHTTAAFHVDDPLSLPEKAQMRSYECSARFKADQGKRAREVLMRVWGHQ